MTHLVCLVLLALPPASLPSRNLSAIVAQVALPNVTNPSGYEFLASADHAVIDR